MQMSGGAKAGGSFLSGLPPSAGRMQKRCSAPLPSHLQKEEKAERTTSVDAAPKKKKSWLNKLGSAATKLKASQSFRKDRRKSQIEKPRSRTMSATTQPTKGGGWKRHLGFRKFSSSGSSRSETKDVDEVITKIFMHFDKTQTGTLSREEFGDMMKLMASGDDLKATLSTEVGRVGFLQHLQSEYSEGSLLCYEACVAFKAAGDPTDEKEGMRIMDTYIKASGDDPVNISSDQRGVVEAAFAESAMGKPVPSNVFEVAEKSLYKLMDRDNHARYKTNTQKLNAMVETMFVETDLDATGQITIHEFSKWVEANPATADLLKKLAVPESPFSASRSLSFGSTAEGNEGGEGGESDNDDDEEAVVLP